MIRISSTAGAQVDALIDHYERRDRLEAARNLLIALEEASDRIERNPMAGLPAPRPYPQLRKRGRLWLHVRPYWIAYTTGEPPVIVAVFYEEANIPGRL